MMRVTSLADWSHVSAGNIRTSLEPSDASSERASGLHHKPAAAPTASDVAASVRQPPC